MYLGLVIFLTGWGFWLANIASLALVPCFILYMTYFQIMAEERALELLFGKSFLSYKLPCNASQPFTNFVVWECQVRFQVFLQKGCGFGVSMAYLSSCQSCHSGCYGQLFFLRPLPVHYP